MSTTIASIPLLVLLAGPHTSAACASKSAAGAEPALAASPARASEPGPQEPISAPQRFVAAATITVEEERGPSVDDLVEILRSGPYLESLRADLRPGTPEEDGPLPATRTYVEVSQLPRQLLSIRINAGTRDRARDALEAILSSLPKLQSSGSVGAKEAADAAEAERALRAQELAKAEAAVQAFVEQNGPVPPDELLERTRGELSNRDEELRSVQLDLATQLSTRDLLQVLLQKEPAIVETRRMEPHPKRLVLERQIEAALNLQPVASTDGKPIDSAAFLKNQLEWIESLEKRLAEGGFADREVVERSTNGRREELEQRIFELDRHAAELKAQEAGIAPRALALRQDASRLWKLRFEWQTLTRAQERAQEAMDSAEGRARDTAERSRSSAASPWLRVVAGPRVD